MAFEQMQKDLILKTVNKQFVNERERIKNEVN